MLTCFLLQSEAQQPGSSRAATEAANEDEFEKKLFKYRQFQTGRALLKEQGFTEGRFNYSYLTNEVLFLSPAGDTLVLDLPENYRSITIDKDTFRFSGGIYCEQVTHLHDYNVFLKRSLQAAGADKKGAYDTYSGSSSSNSVGSYYDGALLRSLTPDEKRHYAYKDYYFVTDRFGNFHPADKKGIFNLFSKHEKALKAFIEAEKIDYHKRADLEKLLQYVHTLK